MSTCQIIRNSKNQIVKVLDNKEKPSKLFNSLTTRLGLAKQRALDYWAVAYSPTFKGVYGDWESKGENEPELRYKSEFGYGLGNDSKFFPYNTALRKRYFKNQKITDNIVSDQNSKQAIESLARQLGDTYNVPVIVENDLNKTYKGKLENGTVHVNLARADRTTPLHEFSHLFIAATKSTNPGLYQEMVQKSKLYPEIVERVTQKYKKADTELLNDEILAEVLGVLSANKIAEKGSESLLGAFTRHISRLIARITGRLLPFRLSDTLDYYSSVLADMESLPRDFDLSKVTIKDVMYQKGSSVLEVIEQLALENDLELDEENNVYTYTDNEGNKIILDRLTNITGVGPESKFTINTDKFKKDSIINPGKKMTLAEYGAYQTFKNAGVPLDETIVSKRQKYTYEQYVKKIENDYDAARLYGKMIHALIEARMAKTQDAQIEATVRFEQHKQTLGLMQGFAVDTKRWNFIDENLQDLLEEVGVKYFVGDNQADNRYGEHEDMVRSELQIFSDLLGIGSTIDLAVEHADGTASIIDWKTSNLTKDYYSSVKIARYGSNYGIMDNKLSRAKLEVMMRAFAMKEHNPDLSFRNLIVSNLRDNQQEVYNVEIEAYLGMIKEYMKAERPEQYKTANQQGLFDHLNYITDLRYNSDMYQKLQGKSIEDQKQAVKAEMEGIALMYKPEVIDASPVLKKKMASLAEHLLELENESGIDFTDKDLKMSDFDRWATNFGTSKNKYVQMVGKVFFKSKTAARKRVDQMEREHDALLSPVVQEYLNTIGFAGTLGKITGNRLNSLAGRYGFRMDDLYAFMWSETENSDDNAVFMNLGNTYTDRQGNVRQMTQAQIAYRDHVKEKMQDTYKFVMSKSVRNDKGKLTQKWKVANLRAELDENFMPRIPLSDSEARERFSWFSKEHAQFLKRKYLTTYIENTYHFPDNTGVPLKYYFNPADKVVTSRTHSLNMEEAYKKFMTSMIMKDEMDSVYAMGEGVRGYLKIKEQSGKFPFLKNVTKMIEDQIFIHVLDRPKGSKDLIMNQSLTIRNGVNEFPIDARKAMLSLKSSFSAMTMWLKPVQGIANGALILMLNAAKAGQGSFAKLAGVPAENIQLTTSTFLRSWTEDYLPYLGASMIGKGNDTKLYKIAKQFNFLTDNYDYRVNHQEMISAKNKLFDESHLYFFHTIFENAGTLNLLSAQMRATKLPDGRSMWDAYEQDENGDYVYTGPTRGIVKQKDGTFREIKGLEAEEIKSMQRWTEHIHGSYREDERVSLELYVFGQWLLQFKKFLPVILKNLFGHRNTDLSAGRYVKRKQNGEVILEEGQDVLVWESNMHEGRALLLAKVIYNYLRYATGNYEEGVDKDLYFWSTMNPDQKQELFSFLSTGMLVGVLYMFMGSFDDDDENKMFYRRLDKLSRDITQGVNPLDLLGMVERPVATISKSFRFLEALTDFLFEGIIGGRTTSKGEVRGARRLLNELPATSGYLGLYNFMESVDRESKWFDANLILRR